MFGQQLIDVYDRFSFAAGQKDKEGNVLWPLFVKQEKIRTEIVLDHHGRFQTARSLKHEPYEFVLTTEQSYTRTSGIFAHPLTEKIEYLSKHSAKKDSYEQYISLQQEWIDFSAPKWVALIHQYILEQHIEEDLAQCEVKPNGMIQFVIEDIPNDRIITPSNHPDVWKSWQAFYIHKVQTDPSRHHHEIDYFTGQECTAAIDCPTRIRSLNDRTKLVRFTGSLANNAMDFKGRFDKNAPSQVFACDFIHLEKICSVLRWLIAKQGIRVGSRTFVSWNIKEKSDAPGFIDPLCPFEDEEEIVQTGQELSELIGKILQGKSIPLQINDSIQYLLLDSADGGFQGRLSVLDYGQIETATFLQRIFAHQKRVSYPVYTYDPNTATWQETTKTPSVQDLVRICCGVEKKDTTQTAAYWRVSPGRYQRLVQTVNMAILKGMPLPQELSDSLLEKCNQPHKMTSEHHRQCVSLFTTLNTPETIHERECLFGELLYLFDRLESSVLKRRGKERETNAKRRWKTFVQQPNNTTKQLYEDAQVYLQKMSIGQRKWFEHQLMTRIRALQKGKWDTDQPLRSDYLHGYINLRHKGGSSIDTTEE